MKDIKKKTAKARTHGSNSRRRPGMPPKFWGTLKQYGITMEARQQRIWIGINYHGGNKMQRKHLVTQSKHGMESMTIPTHIHTGVVPFAHDLVLQITEPALQTRLVPRLRAEEVYSTKSQVISIRNIPNKLARLGLNVDAYNNDTCCSLGLFLIAIY